MYSKDNEYSGVHCNFDTTVLEPTLIPLSSWRGEDRAVMPQSVWMGAENNFIVVLLLLSRI